MGLGHVPSRPLLAARQGPHLPRRERRGVGTARTVDLSDTQAVGQLGERLTRWFLNDHGLRVVAANIRVDRGEIDILALDHGEKVAIEVRTITGDREPIDAVDPAKRRRVRLLARRVGASRVDFVGVRIAPDAVVFHWVPDGV